MLLNHLPVSSRHAHSACRITVGEVFGIPGTPFTLHYQSERMPGRLGPTFLIWPGTPAIAG